MYFTWESDPSAGLDLTIDRVHLECPHDVLWLIGTQGVNYLRIGPYVLVHRVHLKITQNDVYGGVLYLNRNLALSLHCLDW